MESSWKLSTQAEQFGLCCSMSQLEDIKTNFAIPEALIGKCPTCYHNFKKNFCDVTCHPRQSDFVRVDSDTEGKDGRKEDF